MLSPNMTRCWDQPGTWNWSRASSPKLAERETATVQTVKGQGSLYFNITPAERGTTGNPAESQRLFQTNPICAHVCQTRGPCWSGIASKTEPTPGQEGQRATLAFRLLGMQAKKQFSLQPPAKHEQSNKERNKTNAENSANNAVPHIKISHDVLSICLLPVGSLDMPKPSHQQPPKHKP